MRNQAGLSELIQRISTRDKRWLIKKLQHKAPHVAALIEQDSPLSQVTEQNLPLWAEKLRNEPPLLIQAVLDQRNYSWTELFLTTLPDLQSATTSEGKPTKATNRLLASLWLKKHAPNFDDLLESNDG